MIEEKDLRLKGVNLYKDFPYISAKTNSGKTTFAVMTLRHIIENQIGGKIKQTILLTPYKSTYDQVLADPRFIEITESIVNMNNAFSARPENVYVCTYARLCDLLKQGKIDLADSLLIYDELHKFVDFATWQEHMKYLVDFMLNKDLWESTICVGMTGTPQVIDYIGDSLPFNFIDITPKARTILKAKKGVIIDHGSIESTFKKLILENGAKGILGYVSSAKEAIKITRLCQENDLKAAFIISKSNSNYDHESGLKYCDLMAQQVFDGKSIYDCVTRDSDLPPDLDVLIINDAASDGINILDQDHRFNQVIIESTSAAVIEQVRSRIRHDIEMIYVVFTSKYRSQIEYTLSDLMAFDCLYRSDYDQERLAKRYEEQRESELRAVLERKVYNDALMNKKPYAARADKLNLAVFKIGKRYIYNPIALQVAQFNLDTYYSGTDGLSTCLNSMLEGRKRFSVIAGSDWIKDLKNQEKLNSLDLIAHFHLDIHESIEITKDQYEKKLSYLDLQRADRKKAGKTALKRILEENGIEVRSKQKKKNGIRSTYYTLSRKK